MSDQDNQDFFENLQALENHFKEAFDSEENRDALFYDEISDTSLRYQVQGDIDQGGMKKVLRSKDLFTLRDVAVAKLIDADQVDNVDRFIKEARLTASLQHPNIMPVYDMGLDVDGQPYFTMKLFDGQALDEWFATKSAKGKISDQERYRESMGISAMA